ncbi:MAG: hypothetical protein EOO88_53835 [Pedobacter sp.]|nr:MAG: hypothetical protein EOO88_53835 [Pedobacter sp.]
MCAHEEKYCPRCNKRFECKPGSIAACQCVGVNISVELRAFLKERYSDCLCNECLVYLSAEPNLFKERYRS